MSVSITYRAWGLERRHRGGSRLAWALSMQRFIPSLFFFFTSACFRREKKMKTQIPHSHKLALDSMNHIRGHNEIYSYTEQTGFLRIGILPE